MLNKDDKIKNYILEKYLGEGSFGEVWLAKKQIELSDEGILVALKFLKYKPSKDETQEKFIEKVRREVATWIKASGHKNIVSVQDGFQFQTDTFVIVSDFADGGDLGNWLKSHGGKSPDLRKTVEIFCEILEGLQHLHTQTPEKIIHRDLKPDNILFKNGLPCITDFGVSRMSNTVSNSMVKGSSAGTPLYMSPEVLNNKPASRSMDIWSMGVMLYEMLSGNYPYFPQEGNIYSLILDIIQNPYQPLPSNIPFEFQKVVAKALEKDVNKRYQSAEEMRFALKKALKVWEGSLKQGNTIDDEIYQHQQKIKPVVLPNPIQNEPLPTEDWREIERRRNEEAQKSKLKQRYNALLIRAKEAGFQFIAPSVLNNDGLNRLENQIHNFLIEKQNRQNSQPHSIMPTNFVKWTAGGVSALLLGIFGIIGINSLWLTNNQSTVKTASNTASTPNTGKEVAKNTPNLAVDNKNSDTTNASKTDAIPASNKVQSNNRTDAAFTNSTGIEFVKIPAGSFMMGSPENESKRETDEKQHKVTIGKDFYLGKYEVTQAQWKAVMGKDNNPSSFKGDSLPVESVSWDDAKEFIGKLNGKNDGYIYSLPSEAEWEYACRAGTTTAFSFGDSLSSSQANFNGNYPYGNASKGKYLEKTANVGSYQKNDFGLFNMHGNVWEWCEDIYESDYSKLRADGSANMSVGVSSSRVLRGGSWYDLGNDVRSAIRGGLSPADRDFDIGFRVAARVK